MDISQASVVKGHECIGGHLVFSSPGYSSSVSPLGFQLELDGVILALASALSHACEPPAGASRKVKGPQATEPTCVYRAAPPEPWGFIRHADTCAYTYSHIHVHADTHVRTHTCNILHTRATYTHSYILVCTYRYSHTGS